MKVLLPGQVARFYYVGRTMFNDEERSWMTGIPVSGHYVDVDDYFVQKTRGKAVNDVIHAKLCSYDGRKSKTAYCGWGEYRYADYLEASLDKRRTGFQGVEFFLEPGQNEQQCNGYYYNVTVTWTQSHLLLSTYWIPEVSVQIEVAPEKFEGKVFRSILAICRTRTIWDWDHPYWPRIVYDDTPTNTMMIGPVLEVFKELENAARTPDRFDSYESANRFAFMKLRKALRSCDVSHIMNEARRCGYEYNYHSIVTMDDWQRPPRNLRQCFLFHEPDMLDRSPYTPLVGYDPNLSFYWKEYLLQHAVRAACDNLPRLNDNSIQNILELASFMKSLIVDHKVEIPDSLSSAWLAYRYSFNTTKMDLEEALKFVKQNVDLDGWERSLRAHGSCRKHLYDTNVVATCSFQIAPKNLSILKRIWRALDTYGLTPDFYVVWDSIPYSFIVDWFIPVGDMLSTKDVSTMQLSGEYYEITNVSYSLKYIRRYHDGDVSCYARWAGSLPSGLNPLYWFDVNSPSDTTIVQRVIDAGSLFIGKV